MNGVPKYVVSSILGTADWTGFIVVKGNLATEIGTLQDGPGGDLLLSGGQLLNGLNQANVIDLYRFMVHPVILGKGACLFADGIDRTVLQLTHAETFGFPIGILEYAPVPQCVT